MTGRAQQPGGKTWSNLMVGDWADDGICAGQNPDWWFPPEVHGRRSSHRGDDRRAKEICRQCPVIKACLEHALTHGESDGIWGGMSSQERAQLQRDRKGGQDAAGATMRPILIHGGEDGYKAHLRRGERPCRSCTEGSARASRERRHSQRLRERQTS